MLPFPDWTLHEPRYVSFQNLDLLDFFSNKPLQLKKITHHSLQIWQFLCFYFSTRNNQSQILIFWEVEFRLFTDSLWHTHSLYHPKKPGLTQFQCTWSFDHCNCARRLQQGNPISYPHTHTHTAIPENFTRGGTNRWDLIFLGEEVRKLRLVVLIQLKKLGHKWITVGELSLGSWECFGDVKKGRSWNIEGPRTWAPCFIGGFFFNSWVFFYHYPPED